MTIPAAPLPDLWSLLRTASAYDFTGERWAHSQQESIVRVYRRGSFALAAGAEAVRRRAGSERVTVWVPDYFCNEALDPLRCLPVALRFYPILEDLTPDWPVIESSIANQSEPHVFMLVHYFGFPNATRVALEFCDRHRMVLLEDAAHVLLPGPLVGLGDLLVFSPRKLLAVPSGGMLVTPTDWGNYVVDPQGNGSPAETLTWLGKRLAQQVLVRLHVPWHPLRRAHWAGETTNNVGVRGRLHLEKCNPFALRLLTVLSQHLDYVITQRRRNYQRLLDRTRDLVKARPLLPEVHEDVCPYVFPILVESGSADVVAELQANGIPAGRWPDLPPEVLENTREHEAAIRTYARLLLLPVHQSLNMRQIDAMVKRLHLALSHNP